jgi:hypothetical protein
VLQQSRDFSLFGFASNGTLLVSKKMTDSQTLLAEYVRTGSDSAFRELVTRYLGLVYSTALRLVDGDTHLAAIEKSPALYCQCVR